MAERKEVDNKEQETEHWTLGNSPQVGLVKC